MIKNIIQYFIYPAYYIIFLLLIIFMGYAGLDTNTQGDVCNNRFWLEMPIETGVTHYFNWFWGGYPCRFTFEYYFSFYIFFTLFYMFYKYVCYKTFGRSSSLLQNIFEIIAGWLVYFLLLLKEATLLKYDINGELLCNIFSGTVLFLSPCLLIVVFIFLANHIEKIRFFSIKVLIFCF